MFEFKQYIPPVWNLRKVEPPSDPVISEDDYTPEPVGPNGGLKQPPKSKSKASKSPRIYEDLPSIKGTFSKNKVSHARKTAPGHIKRPPNAFILFRSHCCVPGNVDAQTAPGTPSTKQLTDLGITDHRHISRIVSHLWKALSPEDKAYWDNKAQEKKTEHALLYPDYRYKPVYRNKDDVRKRRKGTEGDVEEEKRGCEEVAKAMLGPDDVAPNQTETAIQDLLNSEKPVYRGTAKKAPPKPRKAAAASTKPKRVIKKPVRDDSPMWSDEGETFEDDLHAGRYLPGTSGTRKVARERPYGEVQDQPPTYAEGYGDGYGRTSPSKRPRATMDDDAGRYHPSQRTSSVRRSAPAPLQLDYDQGAQYSNPAAYYPPVDSRYQYSPAPPMSGQHYGYSSAPLNGQYDTRIPTSHAGVPYSSRPTPVNFAGMRRRGTFSRTSEGGNLMLVSPCGVDMGYRKFSLGVWDPAGVDFNSQSSPFVSEFVADPPLAAFAFDPASIAAAQRERRYSGRRRSAGPELESCPSRLAAVAELPTRSKDDISPRAPLADALLADSRPPFVTRFTSSSTWDDKDNKDGLLSPTSEAAMSVLERSQLRNCDPPIEEGGQEQQNYIFLTLRQAEDAVLVDSLLK